MSVNKLLKSLILVMWCWTGNTFSANDLANCYQDADDMLHQVALNGSITSPIDGNVFTNIRNPLSLSSKYCGALGDDDGIAP